MAANSSLAPRDQAEVQADRGPLAPRRLERIETRQKRLLESEDAWEWIGAYSDVIDRMRGPDRDFVAPISIANDRRYGAYWPFWRTWLEHARLRAAARVLYGLSTLAQGALGGLCNYVIDRGFVYRATAIQGQNAPPALIGAVQATLKEFAQHNAWGQRERECFIRDRRDGEFALRDFPQNDGMLEVRTVDAPQIVEPANCYPATDSFGIINEEDDLEKTVSYSVSYDGNSATAEDVPADEITYHKCNVDRIVKRGLTDLCFDTYDTIKSGQKLIEALSEGSAIQASIALLRQHDQSTAAEVSGFVDGQQGPHGRREERFHPGQILDAPKGMEFVTPPFAANAQGFVVVVQAVLRSVAVKWNAPEWLISGDASNNNYSSSITAESPFVKSCKAAQGDYQVPFTAVQWKAVKAKCDANRMRADGRTWSYEEVRRLIDIQCEPPTIEVRDKAGESQVNTGYMQAGIKSPQTICQEQGLDYDQEMQNLEEHNERFGQQGQALPGLGAEGDEGLPADGLGAAAPGASPAGGGESAASSLRATVGGSAAIAALQTSYYAGQLPREAAIANAVIVFGFDQATAERLFPAVAPVKLAPDDQPPGLPPRGPGGDSIFDGGGESPAAPPRNTPAVVTEALIESVRRLDARALAENFSGMRKDKAGHNRCYLSGKPVPCAKLKGTPHEGKQLGADYRPSVDAMHAAFGKIKTAAHLKEFAEHVTGLTRDQLRDLRKRIGAAGAPLKANLIHKIRARAEEAVEASTKGADNVGQERGTGSEHPGGTHAGAGGQVAGQAGGPSDSSTSQGGHGGSKPADSRTVDRVPAKVDEVNRRLDRFEKFFRTKGQHHVADWMGKLRDHVNKMGGDAALAALGQGDRASSGSKGAVQYWGVGTEEANWKNMGDFMEAYLERNGIVAVTGDTSDPNLPLVSALGKPDKYVAGQDFKPASDAFKNKLDEAKHLPGLEKSEDIGKLMGKPVTHLTQEVTDKLDKEYGPGQWIVKCYDDNAAAGYGIFFPQRAAAVALNARNTIWTAGEHLDKYGFQLGRDPKGMVFGIIHKTGDIYQFGTPEYEQTIHGDARHWAEQARAAADNENGALLPEGAFMAQPAFKAVGISDAERAAGKTWHESNEGRVHLVIRDGKAEVIPHATWLKGGNLPVVFENDDTRAMAKAAQDAINALPPEARKGQAYSPDVMKTADGYRVVELNAQGDNNGSGYLHDNHFTIDAYVSHITGREPAHVQFIRSILTSRKKG